MRTQRHTGVNDMEQIAECIDKLSGLITGLVNMKIDPEIHVSAMKESLPEIYVLLKEGYLEEGGVDYWEDSPNQDWEIIAENALNNGDK